MIVPRPVKLEAPGGAFELDAATSLRARPGAERAADLLRSSLAPATGLPLPPSPTGSIRFELDATDGIEPEGYRLRIDEDGVHARAATEAGLFHAVQTIRQLLPVEALSQNPAPAGVPWRIPYGRIDDAPRFAWRGFMLDVARHFQPIPYLRRLVDVLAFHKLNVLHLHLTDDQGWRIEIDRYPALTEVGAWRTESLIGPAGTSHRDGTPHGGFYTRAELRTLAAYADERGVRLVPEFNMPGHARAALAAYPELGNRPGERLPVWSDWGISEHVFGVHDAALGFCRNVLDEIMDTFPGQYVHVGGDECPTSEWKADPAARARAAELGLAAPEDLYGWFVGQMTGHILRAGRLPICWDEAVAGGTLDPAVTVMAWRDISYGTTAARRGHPVVMAPWRHTYLDYAQTDGPDERPGQPGRTTTLSDVYAFEPMHAFEPTNDSTNGPANASESANGSANGFSNDSTNGPSNGFSVLGTQAQLWSEFARTPHDVDYLTFPRLCALAEVAWSAVPRDPADFQERLAGHLARLDALDVRHAMRAVTP
ncbi:beta-N-acetylhexosaminidase [Actinomadura barringtoniae]|uniref:beta-N-acetylhexosaminidase n=1 Tax=Actinomadura barringtoniae TaxID=1427535 RepID=A0A939T6H0_9ACTN|nr:beta-N-acetylhexosaminidase [Actinomadura barringtoniae]MBO2448252.1 beta-N-acetylhexosaminidase [Actinomadura barringtoniae]